MVCQICRVSATNSKFFIKDYEYDLEKKVEYKVCRSCTVIYRDQLNKKTIKKLYTTDYLPVSGGVFYDFLKKLNSSYEWRSIKKIKKNKSYFKHKKLKILDIACGKGFLIEKISKNLIYECIGIDINQVTKNKKNNLSYYKKSFNDFSFIKKINADFIILNNFLEHIENLKDFKKFLNILNKKNHLIIITPDSSSISKNIFGKYWSGYHSPRHVNIFNKKSITLFLKKNNLDFSIENILDPLSTISSLKNCYTDCIYKFNFKKLYKLLVCLFKSLADLINKNRMLIICKKK